MRAAAHLLAVLLLAAAGSAVAREKHLIDPTPPGSLNPEPLPPLQNPDAPSTPAKELFARKSRRFPGRRARSADISTVASPAVCHC